MLICRRIIGVLVLGFSSLTWASPSVYINASNRLRDIKNEVGAKIIGDHQNKAAVYVLPPSLGVIELKNFRATTNLAFCDELADLVKYSKARTTELGKLAAKREKILDQKIDAEAGKKEVEEELKKLRSENPKVVEYENLKKDTNTNRDTISKFERENADLVKKYNDLRTAQVEIQASFEELDKRFVTLEGRIADIKKVFDSLYEKFAKREGGFANFDYDTGWDKQIATLQKDNPGYQFDRVFTKEVRIYAKFIGAGDRASYEASLPAVLDYVVNGETFSPGADKPQTLFAMPANMSAHVRLSLAGACALVNPDLFQIKKTDSGAPAFGLAATYQFPSVFAANVKVTYNRHQVYNQIKKEGKATAVFTTRQMKKVVDDKDAWAHMKVEWNDNGDGEITEADKQKIIQELRKEIMSEVLEIAGVPNPEREKNVIENDNNDPWQPRTRWQGPGRGGNSGSGNSGGGLGEILAGTCEMNNIYCVLGGFILKGLNAIFGGDRVDSEFYTKVKAEVTREMSTTAASMRTGITVFSSEK